MTAFWRSGRLGNSISFRIDLEMASILRPATLHRPGLKFPGQAIPVHPQRGAQWRSEALTLHFRHRHRHTQSLKLSAGVFGLRLGDCKLHVVFSDQLDSIWLAAAFSGRCLGLK